MDHSERPKKFDFELPILFFLDMLAIEPDLFIRCIALGLHLFVLNLLLEVLRVQKVLTINVYQLLQFYSQSFGWKRSGACIILVFEENIQIVATIELKRYVTRTGVFGVVVGKLCYHKKPCSVILLTIYKSTKVSFHGAVLLFRLTVSLKVERSRESSLNTKEVTEQGLKLGYKNRSPVTYDGVREAVMLYYHIYDYFR